MGAVIFRPALCQTSRKGFKVLARRHRLRRAQDNDRGERAGPAWSRVGLGGPAGVSIHVRLALSLHHAGEVVPRALPSVVMAFSLMPRLKILPDAVRGNSSSTIQTALGTLNRAR